MCVAVMVMSGCSRENLSDDTVYMFYQTSCPHCHDAEKYIMEKYPNLAISGKDIKYPGNRRLFEDALQKYKITGAAGTPLILLGKHYIMGWSSEKAVQFDAYVKPFLAE